MYAPDMRTHLKCHSIWTALHDGEPKQRAGPESYNAECHPAQHQNITDSAYLQRETCQPLQQLP